MFGGMTVVLNHTIVSARDRDASARFLADLLGLEVGAPIGHFTPVHVNADLTLDFDQHADPPVGHWAFLVDDTTFDGLLAVLDARPGVARGSGPEHGWDGQLNHLGGGRGVYVQDPDGHAYEFFTVVPPVGA